MDVRITPAPLCGSVRAIPSKSAAHRLLICAALSDAPTHIAMHGSSQDIDATIDCLRALGADILRGDDGALVTPGTAPQSPLLDCAESGSTLRFLLPVAAALCDKARFAGRGRLPQRPIGDLARAMSENGVRFSSQTLPFETSGRLAGGCFTLPGDISSQYITGLLLALPRAGRDSRIRITTKIESSSYISMTLSALKSFGVAIKTTDDGYEIAASQRFVSPGRANVEGDWSNAAAFLACGALGGKVTVEGLDMDSPQGDKRVAGLLEAFGAQVTVQNGAVSVNPGELRGCRIDIAQTPDLLPVLAAVAACARGETRFVNGARLRLKESDRLKATADMLRAIGGRAQETTDGLIVTGGELEGGSVDSFHDHRIAMAAAVAAVRCKHPVIIRDAGAVAKSYPGFFVDYAMTGGKADVV